MVVFYFSAKLHPDLVSILRSCLLGKIESDEIKKIEEIVSIPGIDADDMLNVDKANSFNNLFKRKRRPFGPPLLDE